MIHIIGLGPTHDDAPWDGDEKRWCVAWDPRAFEAHAVFEMHDRSEFQEPGWIGRSYVERLRTFDVPVYMQEHYPDIPYSQAYPLNRTADLVGDYFGSSVAFMAAKAILGEKDFTLWGVELSDDHDHQRSNIEYLIGYARGKGLKANVMGEGKLLTLDCGYPERYGWL